MKESVNTLMGESVNTFIVKSYHWNENDRNNKPIVDILRQYRIPGRILIDEDIAIAANLYHGDLCIVMKRGDEYRYMYPITDTYNVFINIKQPHHTEHCKVNILGYKIIGYHTRDGEYHI